MFGPPWGREPFDFNTYLFRRSQDRRPRHASHPHPHSFPIPMPPPVPYGMPHPRGLKTAYSKMPRMPKDTRFTDLDTPTSSDFSSSDWDDSYTLDTDSDLDRIPSPSSLRRRYPGQKIGSGPDVEKVSVKMPRKMAGDLRSDQVLILPALVHLHIMIRLPHGGSEELRAAAPAAMSFGDMAKHVIQAYLGPLLYRHEYTAKVKQRGRMQKPPRDTTLEELAQKGEVYRDGRMEMRVEIVIDGDEGWRGTRERSGGRGPRVGASAKVEMFKKREVSRTRFVHV